MTDIEIAQAHEMKPITEIAAAAGIDEQHQMCIRDRCGDDLRRAAAVVSGIVRAYATN